MPSLRAAQPPEPDPCQTFSPPARAPRASDAQMPFAPGVGQCDLPLPFAEPRAAGFVEFIDAMVAAHAGFILGPSQIGGFQRAAAGVAHQMPGRLQPMANRDALFPPEPGF